LFATGGLGDVVAVTGQIGQGWLRATRGTWRADPSLSGGGFAYDSGAHLLHAMWYLPGVRPVTVSAAIDNCGARVDIVTTAMIRYANGAMGTVACIGRDVHWDENVYVVTTGGSIRTSVHGGRLEHWDAKGKLVCYPAVKAVSSMHQNFVDCILGRAETPCPPIWGLRQALLMEALYESARTGKPAQVAAE
jgi:predicted dehydrogenase